MYKIGFKNCIWENDEFYSKAKRFFNQIIASPGDLGANA